jgi:hypothetical protein
MNEFKMAFNSVDLRAKLRSLFETDLNANRWLPLENNLHKKLPENNSIYRMLRIESYRRLNVILWVSGRQLRNQNIMVQSIDFFQSRNERNYSIKLFQFVHPYFK